MTETLMIKIICEQLHPLSASQSSLVALFFRMHTQTCRVSYFPSTDREQPVLYMGTVWSRFKPTDGSGLSGLLAQAKTRARSRSVGPADAPSAVIDQRSVLAAASRTDQ